MLQTVFDNYIVNEYTDTVNECNEFLYRATLIRGSDGSGLLSETKAFITKQCHLLILLKSLAVLFFIAIYLSVKMFTETVRGK